MSDTHSTDTDKAMKASTKALNIYELVENIAVFLPARDIYLLRSTSKLFRNVLETSPAVQKSLQPVLPRSSHDHLPIEPLPRNHFNYVRVLFSDHANERNRSQEKQDQKYLQLFVIPAYLKTLSTTIPDCASWKDRLLLTKRTRYIVLKKYSNSASWVDETEFPLYCESGITLGQLVDHFRKVVTEHGKASPWCHWSACLDMDGSSDESRDEYHRFC